MALHHVPRCQHVKVNGVQCGSPALRRKAHCYFHTRVEHEKKMALENKSDKPTFGFPLLEDANSIQVALMKVIQMLGEGTLEEKKAGLMIYALQTASNNLRHARFEPEKSTDVVIDEDTVDLTRIEGPQWAPRDFPHTPPAEVQREMDALLNEEEEDELEEERCTVDNEYAAEEDLREDELPQSVRPEISPTPTAPARVASKASNSSAAPVTRATKAPAPVVDKEVLDVARRREQKRKLSKITRELEDEPDSLAAVLLKEMGLPPLNENDRCERETKLSG